MKTSEKMIYCAPKCEQVKLNVEAAVLDVSQGGGGSTEEGQERGLFVF